MPCTAEAVEHFEAKGVGFGPAKAVNAGAPATRWLPLRGGSLSALRHTGGAGGTSAWQPCGGVPPSLPPSAGPPCHLHCTGGVAVSGLEMAQNRVGIMWSRQEVKKERRNMPLGVG